MLMSFFCIILIAFSALMHAGWNLICKSRYPSAAFFLVSTAASIIAMLPFTIYHIPLISRLPVNVWILVTFSAAVQAVYYTSLGNAYRLNEISVAYPLAKAMPVLFIPAVTMTLCLGKQLGGGALLGMLLVSSGCIILPMPSFLSISLRNYWNKGFLYIFIAALTTTAYTIIDSEALKILRHANIAGAVSTTLIYLAVENILIESFLLPYALLNPRERQTLRRMATDRQLLYPAISGEIGRASCRERVSHGV